MSFCFECCVLSSRGLCIETISHTEQSYRVQCECDSEASIQCNEEALAHLGLLRQDEKMRPSSYVCNEKTHSFQKTTDFTSRIPTFLSEMIHVLHEYPKGKQPNLPATDWQLAPV